MAPTSFGCPYRVLRTAALGAPTVACLSRDDFAQHGTQGWSVVRTQPAIPMGSIILATNPSLLLVRSIQEKAGEIDARFRACSTTSDLVRLKRRAMRTRSANSTISMCSADFWGRCGRVSMMPAGHAKRGIQALFVAPPSFTLTEVRDPSRVKNAVAWTNKRVTPQYTAQARDFF
jgi:hypothetical protein